jgi:hypothetical protein
VQETETEQKKLRTRKVLTKMKRTMKRRGDQDEMTETETLCNLQRMLWKKIGARRKQSERSLGKNLVKKRVKTKVKWVLRDRMKLKDLETLPIRVLKSGKGFQSLRQGLKKKKQGTLIDEQRELKRG